RGVQVGPGSIGFASGALNNCPNGCPDDVFPNPVFRVGQLGICATTAGLAVLHWQFSPPAPPTRDTELVAFDGSLVHDPALFADYIINIQGVGGTPTNTAV